MWNQYRKTFARIQLLIAAVTVAIFIFLGHSLAQTGMLFAAMQMGAVVGASYAARIKSAAERHDSLLPLKPQVKATFAS